MWEMLWLGLGPSGVLVYVMLEGFLLLPLWGDGAIFFLFLFNWLYFVHRNAFEFWSSSKV